MTHRHLCRGSRNRALVKHRPDPDSHLQQLQNQQQQQARPAQRARSLHLLKWGTMISQRLQRGLLFRNANTVVSRVCVISEFNSTVRGSLCMCLGVDRVGIPQNHAPITEQCFEAGLFACSSCPVMPCRHVPILARESVGG